MKLKAEGLSDVARWLRVMHGIFLCLRVCLRGSVYLVGGLEVWNINFIFPFSWEFHHPNWRTHIFQRGRSTTNQTQDGKMPSRNVQYPLQGWPALHCLSLCLSILGGEAQTGGGTGDPLEMILQISRTCCLYSNPKKWIWYGTYVI